MAWDLCSVYLSTLVSVCLDEGDDIFLSTASKPAVLFWPIAEDDLTEFHFQVFENCVGR